MNFLCQPSTLQILQDHHKVMIRGTMLLPMLELTLEGYLKWQVHINLRTFKTKNWRLEHEDMNYPIQQISMWWDFVPFTL